MKVLNLIKYFIESCSKNKKGLSLVELIVTMSILALVVAPILGTFITSTKNNVLSKELLSASSLAQKVMEEIKARPQFLISEAGYDPAAAFKEYGIYDDYTVKYRISKEEGIESPLSEDYEYEDIASIFFDMIYTVDSTDVEIEGTSYDLYSGIEPLIYSVDIIEGAFNYSFKLYNEFDSNLQTDSKPLDGSNPLRIKVQYINNSEGVFYLKVNIDGIDPDREVYFYIVDDKKDKAILQNMGSKDFYKYDGIITQQVSYSNVLYKIDVIVEKDGLEASRLLSSVRK